MLITPFISRIVSLLFSCACGLVVYYLADALIGANLDFWYLGEVLGPVIGIIAGVKIAIAIHSSGHRAVPINKVGVLKVFGNPTGILCSNGDHDLLPFCDLEIAPGPQEPKMLEMPGELINAQDNLPIYFGVTDEGSKKKNALWFFVEDATLLVKNTQVVPMIQEAFLQAARVFFSQMARAEAVNDVKSLFGDYIKLLPATDVATTDVHNKFRERLTRAMFGQGDAERIFSDDAVNAVMADAGVFAGALANWGIGRISAQTPNIRMNPVNEAAAASVVQRQVDLANLDARAKKISELVKHTKDETGMDPNLAAGLVASLDGHTLNVNKYSFDGLGALGADATGRIASELVEKGGSKDGQK